MRSPPELYQMQTVITQHFSNLRPAQQRGLALWVYGTILAQSACQSAVVTALRVLGGAHTMRQRLREWLYDGHHKAAPCQSQIDVPSCFRPLIRWVLSWWQGPDLALAIDATLHTDHLAALVISVLYRGTAIPIAWQVLPANRPGAWMPPILRLLTHIQPAFPARLRVLVLADRGLWSPRLWDGIRACGWHPLLRIQQHAHFTGASRDRGPARQLVRPGHAWVERGKLGNPKTRRIRVTLLAIWVEGQKEPWIVVSDLAPRHVGVSWYAIRMWIELGFRALKGVGWRWEHTRRRDPTRVGRYWLVLAVASLWVLAHGTRVEDAEWAGVNPAWLRHPPAAVRRTRTRRTSIWLLGLRRMQYLLGRGRLWQRLWLVPEPWPNPPPGVNVVIID